MSKSLSDLIAWAEKHPWQAALRGAIGTAILGAIGEAIVSGARSYIRAIFFAWHPFPAFAWLVIVPIFGLGILRIWEWLRPPREMPSEGLGLRWRSDWKGRKIVKMDPVCPNPNCGHDLRITQAGGDQYRSDAVFVCDACGFQKRYPDSPTAVLADARRDLEGQADGKPPMPEKPDERSWWINSKDL